jgi:hypothetical protein
VSGEQNAGQSYNTNVGNQYFEIVTQFKYFEKTATNQNSMHRKVNSGLNLGIACYQSVHNIFFLPDAYAPTRRVEIRKTTSIISPVVLIWV